MTHTEEVAVQHEAEGTNWDAFTSTALGLLLLCAQYSHMPPTRSLYSSASIVREETSESSSGLEAEPHLSDSQLLSALTRVYEELAANQIDLDGDTQKVIYSKLWDLYD